MKKSQILRPLLMLFILCGGPLGLADENEGLDESLNRALATLSQAVIGKPGKIAVLDFPSLEGKLTGLSTFITNRSINVWINQGREIVDRAALNHILTEQKLQQSALMDAATAVKVGKLAGAKYFLVGNYARLPRNLNLTLRILSVETGQFVSVQELAVPMSSENMATTTALIQMKGMAF